MVPNTSRYVLAYLLWAVSVALAFVMLLTWRSSAMIALGVTQWDRYLEHAINQFGFLFLAIFGLIVIVFTEYFYRTGVEQRRLFTRFFLITFLELIMVTLAHLVRWVGAILLNLPADPLFVVGEVALCGIAFWLYRRARQQERPLAVD
ncbi:MAG: hypothetical protein R3C14_33095 [Caldilineaceae bacterium]